MASAKQVGYFTGSDTIECPTFIPGCNILAGACYATAGCVFGTVAAPTAPAAILACNSAQGTCMAICAVVALAAPVP